MKSYLPASPALSQNVTPFVGVWIEIALNCGSFIACAASLPSWECGLKFPGWRCLCQSLLSLPSWECGLKSYLPASPALSQNVTPFVGVWIEIIFYCFCDHGITVTPFVGVWIEINIETYISAPSNVTPFVGVWIEIGLIPS